MFWVWKGCVHTGSFSAVTIRIHWTILYATTWNLNSKLGEVIVVMATLRSSETHSFGNTAAWLSQCYHGVQWDTTTKRKWDSCLDWYLERCLCSVKLKRHNWIVLETSGRCDFCAWEAFWHCCHFILTWDMGEILESKEKKINYKGQFRNLKICFVITVSQGLKQQWLKDGSGETEVVWHRQIHLQ